MDDSSRKNYIHLEPFVHQVGGHSSLLCLDDSTVCKPLVPRELTFYETLPEALKKFTPNFYGVVEVRGIPDGDGYISLIATPPDSYELQNRNIIERDNKGNSIRLRLSGSIEVLGDTELFIEDSTGASSCDAVHAAINPWVVKCHRTNLQNIILGFEDHIAQNFILLENLAKNFSHPCILDLKMGTRQYGDAASLPKKQSKMFKVVSTTSGKLGVRIGGMQVYQVTSNNYMCRNKFYGRSLSVSGFKQALCHFLHNGARLRMDVVPALIRRLEELVDVLTSQDAIRFYTTSLLLLYEGDDIQPEEKYNKPLPMDSLAPNTPFYEEDIKRCNSAESLTLMVDSSSAVAPTESKIRLRRRRSSTTFDEMIAGSPKLGKSFQFVPPEEPMVDVRIIDFAHTTCNTLDDPVTYSGPDQGFLFGLENIISLLKGIERDHG